VILKLVIAIPVPIIGCLYSVCSMYRNICLDSCNKRQRDALFLKFILIKNSYMFRTYLLSIIRNLNTIYKATSICHAEMLTPTFIRTTITNTYCCVYSVEILLMMDSGSVRNM